jgi:pimeloyl-ACP methyl ester carboxylesterase
MEEKKISIGGLDITYKVAGSGPAVLILHGWGGSSDSWEKIQKSLSLNGYQVFCPDLPGFGKSQIPSVPWSLQDYLEFSLTFAGKINLNNFILLGHSFGGRIAIKIAAEHPSFVKKLILLDPAGIKIKPSLKTRLILLAAFLGDIIFSLKPLVKLKDLARNVFYFFLKKRDYVKAGEIMRETMKNILSSDLSSLLCFIKAETLIIWGEKDKIVPVKYSAVFKKNISGSSLEIIPKSGHSPHLESPDLLSEKILNFIR